MGRGDDVDSAAADSPAADSPRGGWPLPRSLYVHVPFCRHRCAYCNFSVLAGRDDLQDQFLAAIDKELGTLHATQQPIELDTVYLGGGTPTQLTPPRLSRFFEILSRHVDVADAVEFTCEANPEDINEQTLAILVAGGVNRLSLGVQSFDEEKLSTLSRFHSGEQAVQAIELARRSIKNLSIDLIFAAPGETLAAWTRDLNTAISLPIEHISTYSLTIEKGTGFWSQRRRGDLTPVDEDTDIDMYLASRQLLGEAGLQHYEISSFARPGSRSQHNSVYWNGLGWYAVGPGAARFVGGRRDVNHRSSTTYIKRMLERGDATAERERISLDQHAREITAFGIRQIDGINLQEIDSRVGYAFATTIETEIAHFVSLGILVRSGEHVRLTERGLLLADAVERQILDSI